jgi:sulfatase modifying factor 1
MKKILLPGIVLIAVAILTWWLLRPANSKVEEAPKTGIPKGMVWIPGGEYKMGSDDPMAWDEERPAHRVKVKGFWMDEHELTNAEFEKFVKATGYITDAEKAPTLADVMSQVPPGTPPPDPNDMVPGSLVFIPPQVQVPLNDMRNWWNWVHGADWKHPEGPESVLTGRENHPVVQVSWNDAQAYCKWAGKRLPTEAEWEFAARGGLEGKNFVWGDEPPTDSKIFANTWQGKFPNENLQQDGYARTAPVKSFPANRYGLYDMAGNVWEWCSDWYDKMLYQTYAEGSIQDNPKGPDKSRDPSLPYMPLRVQKGGSFLCHDTYCARYRPSARQASSPESGMSHVGIRCVKDN